MQRKFTKPVSIPKEWLINNLPITNLQRAQGILIGALASRRPSILISTGHRTKILPVLIRGILLVYLVSKWRGTIMEVNWKQVDLWKNKIHLICP